MIDLKEDQLQDIIHTVLKKKKGLNDLLEMILNSLMKLERDHWLANLPKKLNTIVIRKPASVNRKMIPIFLHD